MKIEKVKRLLAVLICAAMAAAFVPCVGFAAETSGTCGDNLWESLESMRSFCAAKEVAVK